jgi:hypothetical protein
MENQHNNCLYDEHLMREEHYIVQEVQIGVHEYLLNALGGNFRRINSKLNWILLMAAAFMSFQIIWNVLDIL